MRDENLTKMSNAPGFVPGVGKCPTPASDKISNAPPPGLKHSKCPANARGGWAPLELTDALCCVKISSAARQKFPFERRKR